MSRAPRPGDPREGAVRALAETHREYLRALAARFCHTPEEAEDLVQEVFLQAWRAWERFDGRSSVSTWLYTIAVRACQRMHRRRVGEPSALRSLDEALPSGDPLASIVAVEADPARGLARREAARDLDAAIAALPVDFRLPFVLKEVVGLPVREVAEILQLKEATVKTRLHRARVALRESVTAAG